MDETLGNFTMAQTNAVLVAAPNATHAIRVWSIFVMSDTAGTVSLLDGTANTIRFEAYPAANGGANKDAPIIPQQQNFGIFTVADGEALDVTTDITGNHAVHVIYEVIRI